MAIAHATTVIIVCFTQLLHALIGRFRQPRVISEMLGKSSLLGAVDVLTDGATAGIILGPSILGRIPHFSVTIFPSASLPFLNLTATIGLIVYLFIVGLQVDTRVMRTIAPQSTLR